MQEGKHKDDISFVKSGILRDHGKVILVIYRPRCNKIGQNQCFAQETQVILCAELEHFQHAEQTQLLRVVHKSHQTTCQEHATNQHASYY